MVRYIGSVPKVVGQNFSVTEPSPFARVGWFAVLAMQLTGSQSPLGLSECRWVLVFNFKNCLPLLEPNPDGLESFLISGMGKSRNRFRSWEME